MHSRIDADTQFALSPGVMLQEAPDGAILLNLQKETMYSLNATGARAVALAVEGPPFGSLVDTLAKEYEADAGEVAGEIAALFSALMEAGLLQSRVRLKPDTTPDTTDPR